MRGIQKTFGFSIMRDNNICADSRIILTTCLSPCIGVCTLDENDICIGCNRHIDEIITRGNNNDKRTPDKE